MTRHLTFPALGLALGLLAMPAAATDIVIYTGGAPTGEGSTYHNGMGQGLKEVLEELSEPYGYTVRRVPSGGAVANANACAEETDNICFGIGQGGLTYDAVEAGRTMILRNDLPGECAMAYTNEPRLPNWASVMENAKRVTFVVAEGSGSEAFVKKIFEAEPALQGMTPKFAYVSGMEAQIAKVKDTRGAVGVFYAYPNPTEGTINEASDEELTIMGILSPAVARTDSAYYLNRKAPYELTWLGLGKTKTVRAMCSKALLFAGDPARLSDEWARGDFEEMLAKLKQLPASAFVPDGGPLSDLMQTVEELSEEYGVNEMVTDLEEQVKETF
ncbi:hypothetical protein LNKW23_20740 [Paralimibaculum aggregatum]|uniref:Uncharacterized protein n=1 Tax=Paralimibaculum aggregatum TaxID=3036245 RepID=A0ABQ6LHU9_9RHOB|nr:hypothetical protein [Limibaculum sp. NKW23]GMG82861.1 hypothetical protein LNKW23_20740 [Limibaculum sp. NKW23]